MTSLNLESVSNSDDKFEAFVIRVSSVCTLKCAGSGDYNLVVERTEYCSFTERDKVLWPTSIAVYLLLSDAHVWEVTWGVPE